MLKVKPSPFCIMDEIDAALDAANTERFADILRDFSETSQFIVITHNPRTTTEAALGSFLYRHVTDGAGVGRNNGFVWYFLFFVALGGLVGVSVAWARFSFSAWRKLDELWS